MREKKSVFIILLFAVLFASFAAGCGEKKEETAMGRYTEREVAVPGGYERMDELSDGGYAMYGDDKRLLLRYVDGTEKEVNNSWKDKLHMVVANTGAASPKGEMIFSYIPWISREEYEKIGFENTAPYAYVFVDIHGRGKELEASGAVSNDLLYLEYFKFAPDGRLYAGDGNGMVYRMDTETGALTFLFQADNQITEMAFIGDTMIALDTEHAWLFDTAEDEMQESVELLDEFVKQHQSGGKSIVLSTKKTEEQTLLYLGCRTGIYRYVWDGSVIEQIADGQFLSFGNTVYKPISMQTLDNEEFRVFFSGNRLVEIYFDETLPARPDKTLHVYSLEEDERIRYAAQLFQKQHPDVLVDYETGITGDNALSRDDALKKLNTQLLSDEAPDLLVLDGLDIEQYTGKGVLKNLDEFLEPYLDENLLFTNIVDGMRSTEDGLVYALPLTVKMPYQESDNKYLGGEQNLSDIAAGMEKARNDHPDGALMLIGNEMDLLKTFVFTSLPAWTDEHGSLNTAKLTEFYEAMQRLWELNGEGMTLKDWETMNDYLEEAEKEGSGVLQVNRYVFTHWKNEHIWATFSYIDSVLWDVISFNVRRELIEKYDEKNMEEFQYGILQGQAQNVFWGQSIVGICEKAAEQELAEQFYELLLSDEITQRWWLKGGMPISRNTFLWLMKKESCEGYVESRGQKMEDFEVFTKNYPDEQQQKYLTEWMDSLNTFYQPDTMLEEIALEAGERVLQGELTPQEGADEVSRRMAIAMEE